MYLTPLLDWLDGQVVGVGRRAGVCSAVACMVSMHGISLDRWPRASTWRSGFVTSGRWGACQVLLEA